MTCWDLDDILQRDVTNQIATGDCKICLNKLSKNDKIRIEEEQAALARILIDRKDDYNDNELN